MTDISSTIPARPVWLKAIAIFALIFGTVTLFSSSSVLFGPEIARTSAGAYVPFVVWFNFAAGFLYIAAAIGIWLAKPWTIILAALIAFATAVTALLFARYANAGGNFEMRTVGALVIRTGFWGIVAFLLKNR